VGEIRRLDRQPRADDIQCTAAGDRAGRLWSIAEEARRVVTASPDVRVEANLRCAPSCQPQGRPIGSGMGVSHHVAAVGSCDRARAMPLRCVIVDDNASFRREIRGLLEEQGIDVVACAASGAEAVQQVAELLPDVVLVDIDLGEESGLDLARQLGEGRGRDAHPDLILISTHDESEYADLIEASPAVGFLAKTDLSAATIRRLLDRPNRSDARPGT